MKVGQRRVRGAGDENRTRVLNLGSGFIDGMRLNKNLDQNIFLLLPIGGRSCLGTERALLRKPDFLIRV